MDDYVLRAWKSYVSKKQSAIFVITSEIILRCRRFENYWVRRNQKTFKTSENNCCIINLGVMELINLALSEAICESFSTGENLYG